MSQSVHLYAVQHGCCSGADPTRTITPNNTTYGDCGSSWLLLWNEGGGYANFASGFQSTVGNVVYRGLHINWTNWDTSGSGTISDGSWMNDSYYNTNRNEYTSAGFVTGAMGGAIQLWWGGQCSIVVPSDSVTVT